MAVDYCSNGNPDFSCEAAAAKCRILQAKRAHREEAFRHLTKLPHDGRHHTQTQGGAHRSGCVFSLGDYAIFQGEICGNQGAFSYTLSPDLSASSLSLASHWGAM